MWFENLKQWLAQYPVIYDNIKFAGIILLSIAVYYITKKILVKGFEKLIKRTKTNLDDLLLNTSVLKWFSFIPPLIVLQQFALMLPAAEEFINRIVESFIVFFLILSISAILKGFTQLLENSVHFKDKPVKGYIQVVIIILYIFGGVIILGLLTGQQPWALLGGLGALTAVILLIFRDTILSFVASIQITSYDLVKIGDWIEVPKYGADGDVIDISLNIIKVQNWDKTITTIPTYKLVEDSFKNWRGMTLSGGRRIKRSIFIDQSSIKFCTPEMLERFSKFYPIKDYLKEKQKEIEEYNKRLGIDNSVLVNGRRLTNIGTFRAYLKSYLMLREDINKNMTFLIRQLQPGDNGLPIEIYVFTNNTAWAAYEDIQSDIFDHVFAVVQQFDLRIFQNPAGSDFKNLISGNKIIE